VSLAKSPQSWQAAAKRSKSARKSAPKVDVNAPKTALDAALSYANKFNWKNFPANLEDGEKKSYLSREYAPGRENWGMANDPKQLKRNFNNRKWCDKCGVGIPTGAVNGIFVIEADTKKGHGKDGLKALRRLEAKYGKLPETLMAASPTGSIHRYYKHPGHGIKVISSASEIANGVDVKGDGGMVIAPPSVRPGIGRYKWLNWGTAIAEAPQWLIDLVTSKTDDAKHTPNEKLIADDLDELTAAVEVIPNDIDDYADWKEFGMKIYAATDGDGFQLFYDFSKRWINGTNSDADIEKAWEQIESSPPSRAGAGSIFYMADKADPSWRGVYKARRLAEAYSFFRK
jgi:hypothetical protein